MNAATGCSTLAFALVSVAFSWALPVQARDASADITFGGSIRPPAECTLRDVSQQVSFGDSLLPDNLRARTYAQPIDYTLECRNLRQQQVNVQISGSEARFDGLLATDRAELGIDIFDSNSQKHFPLNTWEAYNVNALPSLMAAPRLEEGYKATPGVFNATALLVVAYE